MIRSSRFNIYLWVLLLAIVCGGCQSAEKKRRKSLTILRVHVEAKKDPAGRTADISVLRNDPMQLTVDRTPFLSEANIKDAKVVEVMGGFALWLQFDRRGTWMLEQFTSGNKGKRLAIFTTFVAPPATEPKEARWLGAPRISTRIIDGVLSFTPDCTREEADQIALGLTNAAKKYQDAGPSW